MNLVLKCWDGHCDGHSLTHFLLFSLAITQIGSSSSEHMLYSLSVTDGQMNRWTDEHYRVHYLLASLSYAVDDEELQERNPYILPFIDVDKK